MKATTRTLDIIEDDLLAARKAVPFRHHYNIDARHCIVTQALRRNGIDVKETGLNGWYRLDGGELPMSGHKEAMKAFDIGRDDAIRAMLPVRIEVEVPA